MAAAAVLEPETDLASAMLHYVKSKVFQHLKERENCIGSAKAAVDQCPDDLQFKLGLAKRLFHIGAWEFKHTRFCSSCKREVQEPSADQATCEDLMLRLFELVRSARGEGSEKAAVYIAAAKFLKSSSAWNRNQLVSPEIRSGSKEDVSQNSFVA